MRGLVWSVALLLVLSGIAPPLQASAEVDDNTAMPALRWSMTDAHRVVQAAAAYIVCHERSHRPTLVAIRPLLVPVSPADSALDSSNRPGRVLVVFAGDFTLDGLGPGQSGRAPFVGIHVDQQYGATGFAAVPDPALLPGEPDLSLTPLPDLVPLAPCLTPPRPGPRPGSGWMAR